ncbi:MAG: hypothetical protein Q9181_004466 [Wetmoreana brouardii]
MAGGAACYYNGLVYPDDSNPYALPSAWTQFLHNMTNGSSATTSAASTMSMNFPIVPGPVMPTATAVSTGMPSFAPGSGGYNISIVTAPGLATLTGAFTHPKPTTTGAYKPPVPSVPFIGGAVRPKISDVLLFGLVALTFLIALVVVLY